MSASTSGVQHSQQGMTLPPAPAPAAHSPQHPPLLPAGLSPARKYRRGALAPVPSPGAHTVQGGPTALQSDVHVRHSQSGRDQQQQEQQSVPPQHGDMIMDPQALSHLSEPLRHQAVTAYKELQQVSSGMFGVWRGDRASELYNLPGMRGAC
jgi:hypothetical protein